MKFVLIACVLLLAGVEVHRHGGGHHGGGHHYGGGGETSSFDLYRACHEDRVKLCPDVQPPFSPESLFESECFKQKFANNQLSEECHGMMKVYYKSKEQQEPEEQPTEEQPEDDPEPEQPDAEEPQTEPEEPETEEPEESADVDEPDAEDTTEEGGDKDEHKGEHRGHHHKHSDEDDDDEKKDKNQEITVTQLFTACHEDRERLCPEIPPPYTVDSILGSKCFHENHHDMSPACDSLMHTYKKHRSKHCLVKSAFKKHRWLYFVVPAGGLFVFIVLLSCLRACCCRKKASAERVGDAELSLMEEGEADSDDEDAPVDPLVVNRLVEMGFSSDAATSALIASKNDCDKALEVLLAAANADETAAPTPVAPSAPVLYPMGQPLKGEVQSGQPMLYYFPQQG